jgi:N utilization substance protein B
MTLRRKAREFALQMLYQWEVTAQKPSRVQVTFWKGQRAAKSTRAFANALFEGAAGHVAAIDDLLKHHARNWRLDRMAAVDRNVLRLAVYELRHSSETPPKVVINEAVELARKFADQQSAAFINGVLDAVHKSLHQAKTE